jgi:hypothetical protein
VQLVVDDVAVETVVANGNRTDLTSYLGSPLHGFLIDVSSLHLDQGGPHTIKVYAFDQFDLSGRSRRGPLLGTRTV